MKASLLDGLVAALRWANGARIPSMAEDVWADRRRAALRAATGARYGFDCLSVMVAMVRDGSGGSGAVEAPRAWSPASAPGRSPAPTGKRTERRAAIPSGDRPTYPSDEGLT